MEDVTEYYTECMPSVIKDIAVVNMLSKSKSKQKNISCKNRTDISQDMARNSSTRSSG